MARTKRQPQPTLSCFRKPRHLNEEAQLRQLLQDVKTNEIHISKLNRVHKRLHSLPNAWDDLLISTIFDKYSSK